MTVKELLEKLPADTEVLELNLQARYLFLFKMAETSPAFAMNVCNDLRKLGIAAVVAMVHEPEDAVKVLELIP